MSKERFTNKDFVFSKVSLDPKKAYFMYVGSFKFHQICDFFIKPLKRYYGKDVEIIYVFPNFPPTYFEGKYVVINNSLKRSIKRKKSCRFSISSVNLNREVSRCYYVVNLISKILKKQKDFFIDTFKDSPEMTLHKKYDRIKLLGPRIGLFSKYSSKLLQHEMADVLDIPQPPWFLVHSKEDLLTIYSKHMKKKRVFITKLHSASGKGCAIVGSRAAIRRHPHIDKEKCRYIITELLDVKDSPTTEAIVANEKEVFFCGIMDQIMDGSTYLGTIYPSKLVNSVQKLLEEYTVKIGRYLGKNGYRGFFSADFVLDKRGKLFFSEINPRIGGSTIEKVYMHEVTKNRSSPSLPELEFRAITKNTFGKLKSNRIGKVKFSWGVYNVKCQQGIVTTENVIPECNEFDAFKTFKTTILDFPGKDIFYCNGGRVCRIVSVKPTRKDVEKELKEKEKIVLSVIKKSA